MSEEETPKSVEKYSYIRACTFCRKPIEKIQTDKPELNGLTLFEAAHPSCARAEINRIKKKNK